MLICVITLILVLLSYVYPALQSKTGEEYHLLECPSLQTVVKTQKILCS